MDKMIKFSVSDLSFEESCQDIRFATARIKAFASGENAHELPVSDEVLMDSVDSIYKMPVLWRPDFFSSDATGHGDPEEQIPFGFVDPEDANLELTRDEKGRIWINVNAKIWKRYADRILKIFQRDGEKAVSVEMNAVIEEDSFGNEFISKVLFYGITVLGKFKNPAVKDANMEILLFSEDVKRYKDDKNFSTENDDSGKFTLNQAFYVAGRLNIDFNNVEFTIEEFLSGMNTELEHGSVNPNTNVTNDDPIETGKLALAHLNETPNYYNEKVGLEAWEDKLEDAEVNLDNKEVEIVEEKDEVVVNEEVINEDIVNEEIVNEEVVCEDENGEDGTPEHENTETPEEEKEEHEEEEDEEEEVEDEKSEDVDNADDANIEAVAQAKMNENETEEFKAMCVQFEELKVNYETLKNENTVLMEKMLDYENLKTFKFEAESADKEVKMETVLNEINSKMAKFGKTMSQEEKDTAKADFVNFDSIDAWSNHIKALAFSAMDDSIDEPFIRIGLPDAKPITQSNGSVWNRI